MRTQNSFAVRTSFLATFLISSAIGLFLWRLARFFIYPIAPDQISYLVEAQRASLESSRTVHIWPRSVHP